jgi:hypothetical protein
MKEILDQQIPADSAYANGRFAGRTLRDVSKKKLLMDRLMADPAFKAHHKMLFYDLELVSQWKRLHNGFGLNA